MMLIDCDHRGGVEYWCQSCAYDAAKLLREENERLKTELTRLKRVRGKK